VKETVALEWDRADLPRIVWICDDGEPGANLGETIYSEKDLKDPNADRESLPFIAATIAASKTEGVELREGAYTWQSDAQARKALKAAKLGMKNLDTPWPDWAVKAKAAGWTPPKGWKP
jgi:hypothetical protein